jgi:hypothetical protein
VLRAYRLEVPEQIEVGTQGSAPRTPTKPPEVLARSVAMGGDVDTVAAMAGAMVGARVGLSGLGARLTRWAGCLNDQGYFDAMHLASLGGILARPHRYR